MTVEIAHSLRIFELFNKHSDSVSFDCYLASIYVSKRLLASRYATEQFHVNLIETKNLVHMRS